ncbi:MAG: SsrA-binding protein SmpB [Rhodothermales bacterium]
MGEGIKIVATNRKARHDYHIDDTLEAGIVLTGSEVKSLREGRVNMSEAFVRIEDGEAYLFNCHISPYEQGGYANHEPLRKRKLLMHRNELRKWKKATEQKGFTIVPLRLYFRNSYAKVEIGLARGKKLYDKRADIAEQESKRRLKKVMSERNL